MADGVSARGAAGRLDALQPPTAGAVTPGDRGCVTSGTDPGDGFAKANGKTDLLRERGPK